MEMAPKTLAPKTLAPKTLGRFDLERFLGKGRYGQVWKVVDPLRPGVALALKTLAPDDQPDDQSVGRQAAALEYRLGQTVRHPSVLEIIEAGRLAVAPHGELTYLLSRFVPGSPLVPLWSGDELLEVAMDLLSALDAIHAAGYRHGDIQPRNVLVERTGRRAEVCLLDFGLASQLDRGGSQRGSSAGTPRYLSPEGLSGRPVDHRADLYAVGVLLYECLVGSDPRPLAEQLVRTRQGKFFREVCARELPSPWDRLLGRLLDPDPESRLGSGAEGIAFLTSSGAAHSCVARAMPAFESAQPIGTEDFLAAVDHALLSGTHDASPLDILLVAGEAGTGKSRLLAEAEIRAFAAGLRGVRWESALATLGTPGPMESETRTKPHSDSRLGDSRFEASLILAAVAEAAGAAEQTRERAGCLLDGLCESPTALLIDDADSLPSDQEALLRCVIESARTRRRRRRRRGETFPALVLVLAVSAEGGEPFRNRNSSLAGLAGDPDVYVYSTRRWNAEESAEFLRQALPPEHELGAWVEVLRRELDGHPASYRQALQGLHRLGALRMMDGGNWHVSRNPSQGLPSLPGDAELFAAEWRGLAAGARDLLGVCALWQYPAQPVPKAVLLAVCADTAVLERHLRELDQLERLRLQALSDSAGREAVYLSRRQRLAVRRLAGDSQRRRWRSLLAGNAAAPPLERVYQQLRLGPQPVDTVLRAAEAGGPAARALLSYHAYSTRTPRGDRARSSRVLAEMLYTGGELQRADDYLQFAARHSCDRWETSEVALRRAEVALFQGDTSAARELLEIAASSPKKSTEARRRFAGALCAYRLGDVEEARLQAEQALGAHPGFAPLENLVATLAVARGDDTIAEDVLVGALARTEAEAEMRPAQAAILKTNYGRLLLRRGDVGRAAALHREAATLLEGAGFSMQAARAHGNLSVALRRLGDHTNAAVAGARSLDLHRELGNPEGVAIALATQGILARELGLVGTARRRLDAAVQSAPDTPRIVEEPVFLENRALVALELGEESVLEQSVAKWRPDVTSSLSRSETLLLEWRLWKFNRGGQLDRLRVLLETRSVTVSHAPVLYEIARAAALEGEESPPLAELGDTALKRLSRLGEESPTASVFRSMLAAEFADGSTRRAEALARVAGGAEGIASRQWRARALTILGTHLDDDGARLRARSRLRVVLDEMIADVPGEFRERYRQQPEIQEALQVSSQTESSRPSDRKAKLVLQQVLVFSQAILEDLSPDELFRRIVDAAVSLTHAQRGILVLRRHGQLRILAARAGEEDVVDPHAQMSQTILRRTLEDGVARISTDAREDLDLQSIASVDELGLRSVLCVPLSLKQPRLLAALYLDNSFEQGVFENDDLEVAESLCAQAVLAWEASERRQKTTRLVADLRDANQRLEADLRLSRRESAKRVRRSRKQFEGLVGDSAAMRNVFHLVETVAPTDIPILITGESGTGKELIARAVHRLSARATKPFVAENCAAVPPTLLESSLFGYVKGAFTGADRDTRGLFELAHGGTLFLDEIGELAPELQSSLLRVLQEGEVRPLGAPRSIKVDVRVVAATNRDVRLAVREKRFREDVYYRLQGAEVQVPPLRERSDDVPLLVEHLLGVAAAGDEPKKVSVDTLERLRNYPWPGNVRELENEVRRMALLCGGSIIGPEYLSPPIRDGEYEAAPRPAVNHVRPLKVVEQEAILHAMDAFGGHRGKVTRALGLSRSTLYLKLKEMGFEEN